MWVLRIKVKSLCLPGILPIVLSPKPWRTFLKTGCLFICLQSFPGSGDLAHYRRLDLCSPLVFFGVAAETTRLTPRSVTAALELGGPLCSLLRLSMVSLDIQCHQNDEEESPTHIERSMSVREAPCYLEYEE